MLKRNCDYEPRPQLRTESFLSADSDIQIRCQNIHKQTTPNYSVSGETTHQHGFKNLKWRYGVGIPALNITWLITVYYLFTICLHSSLSDKTTNILLDD